MSTRKCRKFFSALLVVNSLLMAVNLFAATEEIQKNPNDKKSDDSSFTVFQFSFFSPLQIFSETDDVYGLRLTLPHGENNTLAGMDIGISNQLNNLYGISLAAFLSQRSGNMYGINFSGFFNLSKGDDIGLSMAGFYNEVNRIEGVQTAFLYNKAKMVNGVQLGVVNYCRDMKGAQIGIINICRSQPFPFILLFNFWK